MYLKFKSIESRSSTLVVRNTLNIYPPNYEKYSLDSEPRTTGFLNRNRQVGKYSFETNGSPEGIEKNCCKNGGLLGIVRVCFAEFVCGYRLLIKIDEY
jgi:hypothetical protein